MKILALGDVHNRQSKPRWRIDNYSDSHFRKLEWCLEKGSNEGCEVVCMPGDIFHSPRASDDTVRKFQALLRKYEERTFLSIFGQHDVHHYRSDLDNTPLGVVDSSGLMTVIRDDKPIRFNSVDIYGANWKEDIPKIQYKNNVNILMIHKMIIDKDKLWEAQESYITAKALLAKNNFDLIISGDNHQFFTVEHNDKTLLNMGSLMRMTSAQLNHKPHMAIYDTSDKSYEVYEIPIDSVEKVFDLDQVEKMKDMKEIDSSIKDYVDILSKGTETKELNYVNNLNNFIDKNAIRSGVSEIILSTLEV